MAASTYLAQVQQLYIAYFGRPADPIGQQYWATQIDAANGSIASVLAGFSASTESANLYGNKSTIDKVTAIYNNEFNRAPDAAGLAFWVAQIDSGKVTQAQAAWTIQQSAGAGDAATVQNKLTAAQAFTAAITTSAQISGYQGTAAADSARSFLNTVTSVNATATAAVAAAPAAVIAATAGGGVVTNFTLTAGVDNLIGTGGNDVFTADNTQGTKQLGSADTINGGAGTDTLRVFLGATDTGYGAPTLTSIESVVLNGGIVSAYTAAAGTTALTIDTPVLTAGALTTAVYTVAGQAVTLKGATVTAASSTTIATAATDTAANLTVNGWNGGALNVVSVTGGATTANLTATGANSSFQLNGAATLKTLNIAGDKNAAVIIGATSAANLTAINASTATGAVAVDVSAATTAAGFAFTGGAGNDTLTLAAGNLSTLTAGTQLNGGAGIDTLVIKDAGLAAADYVKLNATTGFEVLGFGSNIAATSIDASQLTAIKSFAISASTVNESITGLGAGSSVAITGTNTGVVALGAALGNTATDITIGAVTSTGLGVTTLNTTGLTTLSITSNGTAGSVNTIGTLGNADNSTITIKGAADLTITNALAGASTGTKVDASALTGKLTIIGSAQSDIIIGGSGDDVISGGAGALIADTLTGGAGKDKFITLGGVAAGTFDTITDFVTKTDTIVLGATAGTAANFKAATTAVATFDAAKIAADAVFNADAVVSFSAQQVGADTYVFYAVNTDSVSAQVVKLTGVVAANLSATDFVAA